MHIYINYNWLHRHLHTIVRFKNIVDLYFQDISVIIHSDPSNKTYYQRIQTETLLKLLNGNIVIIQLVQIIDFDDVSNEIIISNTFISCKTRSYRNQIALSATYIALVVKQLYNDHKVLGFSHIFSTDIPTFIYFAFFTS